MTDSMSEEERRERVRRAIGAGRFRRDGTSFELHDETGWRIVVALNVLTIDMQVDVRPQGKP